jgi:hypothetical protein
MEKSNLGRKFILSRAVEDPIDATFQLGEDVKEQAPKLRSTAHLSIISIVMFIGILIPSMLVLFYNIFNYFAGRASISDNFGTAILIQLILVFILFSLTLTVLIFLIQIRRFYDRLFQRYRSVSGLQNADVSDAKRPDSSLGRDNGKYRTNPILAMLDLAEDATHQLHKVIHLLAICRNLVANIVIFIGFLFVNVYLNREIFIIYSDLELIFLIIPVILLLLVSIKLESSRNFVSYFHLRHEIIDNVRFGKISRVPEGRDPLVRFIKFLKSSDPYIKNAAGDRSDDFKFDVKLNDKSGKTHQFDAYFEGVHTRKKELAEHGIPSGKFAVFIKVFKNPITKKEVTELRASVNDICDFNGTVPLRTILLQWEIGDLDDDVYEYVLENPIIMQNSMFHLQLIAEDEDNYSFVPIVAYESGGND